MVHPAYAQFYALYRHSSEWALSLVKTWIERNGVDDAKALYALGRSAQEDVLRTLFASLPQELRMKCYMSLARNFSALELDEGFAHMGRELRVLLEWGEAVSESEFLEIARENFESGAILLSSLSSQRMNVMLKAMPAELFAIVSQKSAAILERDQTAELLKIRDSIFARRKLKEERKNFLQKSANLIPQADPEKEVFLYRMLFKAGAADKARETALETLPASLITKIPSSILSSVLTRMSATDRAELIASQPEQKASFLLACLGPDGSKIRSLVEKEIAKIREDIFHFEALQEDADELWATLVATLRQMQRRNPALAKQFEPVVNAWVRELAQQEVG